MAPASLVTCLYVKAKDVVPEELESSTSTIKL